MRLIKPHHKHKNQNYGSGRESTFAVIIPVISIKTIRLTLANFNKNATAFWQNNFK